KEAGSTQVLAADYGYGFGWRLAVGSITPQAGPDGAAGHYLFTDANGAEYRLSDPEETGVWTSTGDSAIRFEPGKRQLQFADGSVWVMEAGPDGMLHPTEIGDTVRIEYWNGRVLWVDTGSVGYEFRYEAGRLMEIVSDAEHYELSYVASAELFSPFVPLESFGMAQMLRSVAEVRR
ncbi:MAG: hypothetical protein GY953_17175, partial [bacterium]|nr:hypothetical protein [bacterium]